MRVGCWFLSASAAAVALAGAIVLALAATTPLPSSATAQSCVATLATDTTDGGPVTLDPEQQRVVDTILTIGRAQQMPPRAWQIAIQAGKTESDLRNLNHGHATSVGVFQIQDMHGTAVQRRDLAWQVGWFYDTLRAVPGWDSLPPGQAAQAVERSAFPDRYNRWEAFAAQILQTAGVADPSGCGSAPPPGPGANPWAPKAIQAALSVARAPGKPGAPYVWGAKGPTAFDCSGLITWAYQQAGLVVPNGSQAQYRFGKPIRLDQIQPGDLVFWADARGRPEAIHHVALALSPEEVVQAPQDGDTVKRSPIWPQGLVPTAIRPGT